jgi:branched-chain amino acid transport system ATP-binding protein
VSILTVEGLDKTFGGLKALSGVSFSIKKGEILGVIGPNGSGKTTLINCITGFIRPDEGKVLFKGGDITRWRPHRIARVGIARTFQVMRPFYSLPAYKNLIIPLWSPRAEGGGWRGGGKRGDRDAVAIDILEEIGFERDSGSTSWRRRLTGTLARACAASRSGPRSSSATRSFRA